MIVKKLSILMVAALFAAPAAMELAYAQAVAPNPKLALLDTLRPHTAPGPNLSGIVVNRAAAIALGKAFFWDQQAGSDGVACASCHFAAGADNRIINQLNPGLSDPRFRAGAGDAGFGGTTTATGARAGDLSPANTAGRTAGGDVAAPNKVLSTADFPLHKLANPLDRNSAVLYESNDVVGSNGAFGGTLLASPVFSSTDNCTAGPADIFHVNGQATRAVAGRNAPTVINSGFFPRSFWDGRANNVFNGEDPFGLRNADAFVVEAVTSTAVTPRKMALVNAALASQAVGPPLSSVESSCAGRMFAQLGRRLATVYPLAKQAVDSQDSVFGAGGYRHATGKGLNVTYTTLIRRAFDMRWWRVTGTKFRRQNGGLVVDSVNGYTQQELNFSMFWGISIMLYEQSLKSDDTPFDRFKEGTGTLTAQEMRGMELFAGKGACVECHFGPMFSAAAPIALPEVPEPGLVPEPPEGAPVNRMFSIFESPAPAVYDEGFYNIGVTPTVQDLGIGGNDPWGNPLSYSRQFLDPSKKKDNFTVDPCFWDVPLTDNAPELCTTAEQIALLQPASERLGVDGAFKTPTLRNVGLTAPYFHNGGYDTLRSVVLFYARGGNRRGNGTEWDFDDTSGTGKLGRSEPIASQGTGSNVMGIEAIVEVAPPEPGVVAEEITGLTDAEVDDLVAFMLALTDRRVQCSAAPFDHPALSVPDGHVITGTTGNARDQYFIVPATGAAGLPADRCLVNSGDLFIR